MGVVMAEEFHNKNVGLVAVTIGLIVLLSGLLGLFMSL